MSSQDAFTRAATAQAVARTALALGVEVADRAAVDLVADVAGRYVEAIAAALCLIHI